jgi:hypothetical protein
MTAKKKRDWQTPTGAAVAGAGGVTTVGGLAAGGIPRAKVDSIALRHVTENEKIKHAETKPKKVKEFVRNIPKSRKGWQGGMGGFRQSAHYIVESSEAGKVHEAAKTPVSEMSHMKAFRHGEAAGKIPPERVIMRQMTGLRRGGHKALAGGLALTAGGVALAHHGKKKHELNKRDAHPALTRAKQKLTPSDRQVEGASGAAIGVGGATAGGLYAGKKIFRSQERKWEGKARHSTKEAAKIEPGLGSGMYREYEKLHGKLIPEKNASKAVREGFHGKGPEAAEAAGKLYGASKQEAYFGRVHHVHAKLAGKGIKPALAVAGVGAAGLAATEGHRMYRDRMKKSWNPRMSAFGVEH